MNAKEIVRHLDAVRRNGGGWTARCPSHKDKDPSLSVHEVDGVILVKCFAGCTFEQIVAALGLQKRDFFTDSGNGRGQPVACYDYLDENGELLYQVVRFSPKTFRQRRPDGNGGWTWKLDGVRRVPYRLPEVIKARSILVCEGEKDCDVAHSLGLVATCNSEGAGKWRPEFSPYFKGKRVVIIPDQDGPGQRHAQDVARSLIGVAASLKIANFLSSVGAKDLSEWVEGGGSRDRIIPWLKIADEVTHNDLSKWRPHAEESTDPWARAETMLTFLGDSDNDLAFLDPDNRIIARESITELFAPRGVGKTLFALWLAVHCARRGLRVMVIDRDNPRSVVKNRLRSFGADPLMPTLKAVSREKCPPLTDAGAWALFPYAEYDVVILDSLDSAAEGVGEQDSAKPSRAIAPLLDIARRENGPAVLVLGNCIKTAAHSRGSGVIEDRADIVYEVRDATDFHPTGRKPWPEELPPADAGSWASRSSRRKQRATYRLAFIATKFRIAEEPEPFILEIDTRLEPWVVRDVTDEVDREGAAERERRASERASQVAQATEKLVTELLRRGEAGEPEILKKEAEGFLAGMGLTQKLAREVLTSPRFEIVPLAGPGHPKAVRLAYEKSEDNRNTELLGGAKIEDAKGADFGCPISMHPTEIDPAETQYPCGSKKDDISVAPTICIPSQAEQPNSEKMPEPASAGRKPREVQWEL